MNMKYIQYTDMVNGSELVRLEEDTDVDSSTYWDGSMPRKGDQIWIPAHGLYEVHVVRSMLEPDNGHIEVKLSFIRRNL